MSSRPTNVLTAAVSTAVCFTGLVAAGYYAAVDDNIGAGLLAFVLLVFTVLSAIWCIVALVFYLRRRSRGEPRGFAVVPNGEGARANRPDDVG